MTRLAIKVRGFDVSLDGEQVEVRNGDHIVGRGRFIGRRSFSTYIDHANMPLDVLDEIEETLREKTLS